jgi:hypothetical protein
MTPCLIVTVTPDMLAHLRKAADFLSQTLTAYVWNQKRKYALWEERLDIACYNLISVAVRRQTSLSRSCVLPSLLTRETWAWRQASLFLSCVFLSSLLKREA